MKINEVSKWVVLALALMAAHRLALYFAKLVVDLFSRK